MKQLLTALGAAVLGAGAMYYLDPDQGRRRRALAGDRADALSHDARDFLAGTRKRTRDRAYGLFATARGAFTAAAPSDGQLRGHIRARLGRLVSHPHAIETEVHDGRVTLRGPILAGELGVLMAAVWAMRGVTGVDNQLTVHKEPGDVPGLQGKPRHPRGASAWMAGALPVLAVAGGLGTGLAAALRRHDGPLRGRSSMAMALLAYGLGDGARRLARGRPLRGEAATPPGDAMPTQPAATAESGGLHREAAGAAAGQVTPPAPPSPSAWQHH